MCTLGNFSTKLLRGITTGITRLHGQPEVRPVGGRVVRLYPLFHPAAALYTPSMLDVLRADFARLPELLGRGRAAAAGGRRRARAGDPGAGGRRAPNADAEPDWAGRDDDSQLGLF